jgi:nucleotide-binding universal stress UspA family protein
MQPDQTRAREDFDQARKEAALQDLLAGLRRKSRELIAFDDIQARFSVIPSAKEEIRSIQLDAVVGSVGRYNDFNRDFLPRNPSDMDRWTSVKRARDANIDLPPIKVYQVGEIFFVIDGNHRVSVAKRRGETEIRASVIEIPARVELTREDSVEEVVRKAALNGFLEATRLDEHPDRPAFHTTETGSYPVLLQQIEMVRYRAQPEADDEVPLTKAARIWYEDHYLPIVEILQGQNLLKHYPDRTETDLYVWLLENHQALADEFGWGVHLETVAANLVDRDRAGGRLRRMIRTAANPEQGTGEWRERRLSAPQGKMFSDIVVVLDSDDPTGPAFRQALRIAGEENAHLLGLWIEAADTPEDESFPELQENYERECGAADVFGRLARGRGERSDLVRARARWADLLVLQSSRGRAPSRALQEVLAGVHIPVWVARREEKPSSRVLLAYDGSPKADEALFLTAYMGALWGSDISVLTVAEPGAPGDLLDHARAYLESFNIDAGYLSAEPPIPEAILDAAAETGAGLLATGSVHTSRLGRNTLGPTLDRLLTDSPVPLLICR